jgi:hypothetical protein
MSAAEVVEGLEWLSIVDYPTLPYSPQQNASFAGCGGATGRVGEATAGSRMLPHRRTGARRATLTPGLAARSRARDPTRRYAGAIGPGWQALPQYFVTKSIAS